MFEETPFYTHVDVDGDRLEFRLVFADRYARLHITGLENSVDYVTGAPPSVELDEVEITRLSKATRTSGCQTTVIASSPTGVALCAYDADESGDPATLDLYVDGQIDVPVYFSASDFDTVLAAFLRELRLVASQSDTVLI